MAMASCPVANCLQPRQASSNAQRALVAVPAQTERAAYGFAADAFEPGLARLRSIATEALPHILNAVERASDTLVRLPDWRRAK